MITVNRKQLFNRNKPYAILCEGADEFNFLRIYLDYLEEYENRFQDCHHIIDLGGINDFEKRLKTIKAIPDYEYTKGILLVRDAETNANAAVDSLIEHIERTWDIQMPPNGDIQTNADNIRIGFFLFPGMDENGKFLNGTLEDLCWDLIKNLKENISVHDLQQETEDHLRNIIAIRGAMRKYHKNRLHVLLSSTDKFVDQKIGEASQAGAFDFSNGKMSRLKELILQMQDNFSIKSQIHRKS